MCFANSDNVTSRTLSTQVSVAGGQYSNTPGRCTQACRDRSFQLAGLENGDQCCTCFKFVFQMSFSLLTKLQVCDNSIAKTSQQIEYNNCFRACPPADAQNQACGGTDAIIIYKKD